MAQWHGTRLLTARGNPTAGSSPARAASWCCPSGKAAVRKTAKASPILAGTLKAPSSSGRTPRSQRGHLGSNPGGVNAVPGGVAFGRHLLDGQAGSATDGHRAEPQRPHRLSRQDAGLSSRKAGFDSQWGYSSSTGPMVGRLPWEQDRPSSTLGCSTSSRCSSDW